MEFELVKIKNLCNENVSVYTLLDTNSGVTLFENFLKENKDAYPIEVKDIVKRLMSFKEVGTREIYFKINEGKPGDGVCSLYDE